MSTPVQLNITIPVFNRFLLSQKTILALNKARTTTPPSFIITVVNNGSDKDTSDRLLELKTMGLIDKLFVLKKNMGIACACNIGWEMTPEASYYMKLDNDFMLKQSYGLQRLFSCFQHLPPTANLGPADSVEHIRNSANTLKTATTLLGLCTTTLRGAAIIVPQAVSRFLGLWNEEYDFHGADDGDYGLRMLNAGFPQYYYDYQQFFHDLGLADAEETYQKKGINKQQEHSRLFLHDDGSVGLFALNRYLYTMCIRSWKVPRRYEVVDVDEHHGVRVQERKEYPDWRAALEKCRLLLTQEMLKCGNTESHKPEFVETLKNIIRPFGQCPDFPSV